MPTYDERTSKHIALLLAAFETMQEKLSFPMNAEEFQALVLEIFEEQQNALNNIDEVNEFWDIIGTLIEDSTLKNKLHFKVNLENETPELIIALKKSHQLYRTYCIKNHIEPIEYNSLRFQLKNHESFIKGNQEKRGDAINVRGIGSSYQFDINKLPININS